jgi:hypothetical protein
MLVRALNQVDAKYGPIHCVVHGAARGADTLAKFWAQSNERPETPVEAKWRVYGNAAGPIRNNEMLTMSPDMVVAFPGGPGTADMVRKALAAGITVLHVDSAGKFRLERPQVAVRAESGNLELCLTPSPSQSKSQ